MRTPSHLGGHWGVTHVDEGVLDYLVEACGVRSLLDVGRGPGGMLRLGRERGLRVLGVDGDPTLRRGGVHPLPAQPSDEDPAHMSETFVLHDYTQGPLHLDERFDLAWSVEFLEHVEEQYQANYMATFASADLVFCTAAPPGKAGYHHVNCQGQGYWRDVFAGYGWRFEPELTARLREASTVTREFVRESGMAFSRSENTKRKNNG